MLESGRYTKKIQTLYPEDQVNRILSEYLAGHGFRPFHYESDLYVPNYSLNPGLAATHASYRQRFFNQSVWKKRFSLSGPYFIRFQCKAGYVLFEAWRLNSRGINFMDAWYFGESPRISIFFKKRIEKMERLISISKYSG